MTATVAPVGPRSEEHLPAGEIAATWWRQNSPGCYYWRCLVPARHLPGRVIRFKTFDITEPVPGRFAFPRVENVCISQFPGNATQGTLLRGMQTEGIRVFVEVDDSYLRAPDVHGGAWQNGLDRSGKTDRHSYEAHARICEFADGIIVSVPSLADEYRHLNTNIHVCPNSVEPADWPEPEKPGDGILRIGWAASHSHLIDAPLVRRALMWAAAQPGVEVHVYGVGDVYKFPGAVKKVAWTDDLDVYRRSLALCDVHICPLDETPWSRNKSDIKAMEAAMAGAWPIVSTATAYQPWRDRTLMCTTAKDWMGAMRWVVAHRDEIRSLAAEAKAYVMAERTIDRSIGLWKEAISSCGS